MRGSIRAFGFGRIARAAAMGVAGALVAANAAQAGGTVTLAQGNDPRVLDPAHDTAIYTRSIMTNIYDHLVWRTGEGNIEPALAASWEFLDDVTLKLNLRKGVKFHDGSPFTADDVIFSAERYLDKKDPKPLRSYLVGMYERIEKVDDHTIIMHTGKPNATIFGQFARMPILPRKAFTAMGDTKFGASPVGTGPFMVDRWAKNEVLELKAFDDHWRGRASIDRYHIKPIPEDFGRYAALKTGDVDMIANLAPERIPEVNADAKLKVITNQSARQIHIGLNTNIKPFSDVRVRQALNHAVNVQEIVDTVLGGYGKPNPSLCGEVLFGHDSKVQPYEYNPAKAKQLLAAAGYPDGFKTRLLGPTARYMKDREIQQAVAGQLAKVGVVVEHVTPEWADFLDQWYGRKKYKEVFQGMYLVGTGGPTMDCNRTLVYRIGSKGRLKYYRTDKNEMIDKMIAEQQVAVDPNMRVEIMGKIQKVVRDDAPWIFLYDQKDIYGVTKRIQWTPRPDEFVWAYDIKVSE